MRVLGIDSSAKAASAAVLEGDKLLGEYNLQTGYTHSETLLPMVDRVLRDTGTRVDDLELIAVTRGPGSFTGLRIGLATVKGLCFARELPVAAVSTLEALACNVADFGGLVCCAMDARCGQVYQAFFRAQRGEIARVCEDRAVKIEQLEQEIKKADEPILLVGDGAHLCYNSIGRQNGIVLAPAHLRLQRAASVGILGQRMAARGDTVSSDRLVPEYLRLPQAERERLKKEQREESIP